MKKNGLLEELFNSRMIHALETTAATDQDYLEVSKKEDELLNKLDKKNLNRKQRVAVDRVISAANSCGAEYGRMAYRQGFQDAIKLIAELSEFI